MFFLCLQTPLDYITYIGCSISFLCLLVCIVFFLALRLANKTIKICSLIVLLLPAAYDKLFSLSIYRKELIQKLHNFVHLNLCIALALGLLLFLTGIQTATANVVSDSKQCILK